jgi:RHS repeat-associated protein
MAQRPFWLILICFWFVGHARCSAQGQPGYLAPGGGTSPGLIVSSSVGRYVTFNWGATTGTASYQLNIRDVTSDPNGPVSNYINNGGATTTISVLLASRHAYKWNVYACSGVNATGTKTLSTNAWFRFLNPPYLESPGNTSSDPPITKVLSLTPWIQWDAVPEADGYWLYLSQSPYGPSHIVYSQYFSSSSTISFYIPANVLSPGTAYAWNITSLWGTDESPTLGRALYFTVDTLPTAPSTLTASGGSSQIGLVWYYTSANAFGQKLERKDGINGTWNQIADLDWNVGGYTDFNVSLGITYYYRIYAYNGIGNSATSYSSGASLTLPVSISVTDPNGGQPLQANSTYTVSFSASGSTASIAFYDFAFSLDGGISYSTPISGISSSAIGYSWTVPSCTSTAQGQVRVRAFNNSNAIIGSGSNPNNFTINSPSGGFPSAVADVTTTSPSPNQYVIFSGSRSLPANACTPIVSYSWTFPDGTYPSANSYLIRSFSTPSSSFTVTLKVYDSAGNFSTAYLPINVSGWGQGVSSSSSFSHDPVNLANGNYVYQHTDLRIAGKGFPFEFKRFYNSQFSDQTGRPLGYGWTHNYNILLATTATNATVAFGDGHSETYFLINGQYQPDVGVFNLLTTNANGSFTLTGKDQTRQIFSSQGQLSSVVDKNGNTLSLSYGNGVLTNITDTAGRQIVFQNDANGRVTQINDPIGRLIQFQYDGASNLIAAIDANLRTNTFNYDTNHQMTAAYDARGTRFVINTYDDLQRVVNYQADAYTNQTGFYYDFVNHVTYVTNVFGKVSIYRHDNNLLVTNIVDEAGNQQLFSYDTNRNRTFIQDKNGNQTRYGYDLLGNVTNKIDALTDVTTIQYDARNNPIRRVDALTNATTFGYDSQGNLTSTTNALSLVSQVHYDASGLPIVLTDARGNGTTNQYDAQDNPTNVIDAHGFAIQFVYDGVGRKIRQIDTLHHATSFAYDNDDDLLFTTNALNFSSIFAYDGNNNRTSSQNPRNAITTNVFDLKDRMIAVLAPLNQTNGTLYDALDRKIATFDALGNHTGYTYDDIGNLIGVTNALAQVIRFTYDPQGNQTSVIDPTGHYVTNFFDALNRKVATIDISTSTNLTAYDALGRVTATTNANGQITQFFYDAIGRITNVVDAANKPVFFAYDQNGNRILTTDPNGHSWTNNFDELNRLVEQDDPLGHKTTFYYDPVGNLTNKVTANGDSINYSYDALNRLNNIAYPSGTPVAFAYDSVGNRTNMTDSLGTTAWQFDLLNRLTSVTDPYGQTVANGFDANGNRVSLTYPGNKTVNYSFDVLNRMTTFTNWLNGVVTYSYDSRGNLISAANANNTAAAYAYDVADRLVALTNAAPDASVIAAYVVTLDGIGNHTQAAHNQPLFPILPNQTNNYAYDSDNRLVTIDSKTVTHNANGDLTNIGTNSYSYDFEDWLVQVSLTNTFTYDGLGNRLARTGSGQARRFILDRMGALTQVLVENDTNNSPVAYYVYGLGLAEQILPGGTVATYHYNIQGSTVALTGSGGNITDSYAFDSFGVLANTNGSSPQPFRYLGRYGIVDDSTGLLYARARYFSPQLGRFITKDIATSKDNDGQSLNRFVYALNNPVRFRDASGLVATEGISWSTLNLSLRNLILQEQREVLNSPTANSTPMTYSGPNVSSTILVNAVGVITLFIPGFEEVGGALFVEEAGGVASVEGIEAEVASSRVLGRNLEDAGTARPLDSAAHHIVAGNDPRAAQARAILQNEGIGINNVENGVFLPQNTSSLNPLGAAVHSIIHTDVYYDAVNAALQNAQVGTVGDVLQDIAQQLLNGTFSY